MQSENKVLTTNNPISPMDDDKNSTSTSRPSVDMTRRQHFETTTDIAAASLVRRILGSHQLNIASHAPDRHADNNTQTLDANLPPLTSSNEIDLQLYALIAILIKDCVQSWYSRFTTDHTFVDELLQIIAHCTRALEERLRRADLERLLLDTIPAAIDIHIQTFRQCRDLAASRHLPADDRILYSTLLPHTALLPTPTDSSSCDQQQLHESTYRRLLAEGILALLVPAEDLRNTCLKSLLTEILADMILGGLLSKKLCDGTFIYDMVQRAADSARGASKPWAAMETPSQPAKIDRLAHFGLLSPRSPTATHEITNVFWSIVGYLILTAKYLQTCFNSWMWTTKLPTRSSSRDSTIHDAPRPDTFVDLVSGIQHEEVTTIPKPAVHLPMISYHLWTMAATIVDLAERMPWLIGIARLTRHFLLQHFGDYDGYLDRVLAHVVLKPAFPLSKHLPGILLALRTSLFPENTMLSTKTTPTTTVDPSATKQKASRGAAVAILNAVPASIAHLYLKPSIQTSQHTTSKQRELDEIEQMVAAVQRDILSPFGADEYLTKHLLYTILDHIVLEIFPELSQKTVSQILADKEVAIGSEQDDHLEYAV